jgi:hypothetical protein
MPGMVMRELDELAERLWAWRARTAPRTRDDIPRLDRPVDWRPDFAADAVAGQRATRGAFAKELASVRPVEVADRVDHRLLRSALARVEWELDVVRAWQRQPRFYTDQTLGPVFDLLVVPGVDETRVEAVIAILDDVGAGLTQARENLAHHAYVEFAGSAVAELAEIGTALSALAAALAPLVPALTDRLTSACARAGSELVDYRDWLVELMPSLPPAEPVGVDALGWFLAEVACVPVAPAEIAAIGRREADAAVVRELLEHRRNADVRLRRLPVDGHAQARRAASAEEEVRDFYAGMGLLTIPADLAHYRTLPMPDYLQPLRFLGVADDLTGPDRLDEVGTSWFPEPAPDLPYFYAANARDPRAGIVHEGAHHQQLALSWRRARPIRRHYYDSAANEGIAFYNEELMLASGLFEDAPHSRTTMFNFMRLRALRVGIDIGLATGEFGLDEAARRLAEQVPMDPGTAAEEAAFFAETPGQAMSYQVGKTQLLALIADAVRHDGRNLDLRALHDRIWVNGNVPIALQRWEILGLTDELAAIGVTLDEA